MKKINHIEGAMQHHRIIFIICVTLVVIGFYCLPLLNKDEFPQFTIRQGIVAGIYPGASAQEVEEQLARPLERYLFGFEEVDKDHTYSISENGIAYVFVELRKTVHDKDAAWSKIRHGLSLFKTTSLPVGVLEVVVIDDFGNTTSILLAVESEERTPRELEQYAEQLSDRLRTINEMGNLKMYGTQREEIAVTIDDQKLSAYGIDQKILFAELATQGIRTVGDDLITKDGIMQVQVKLPYTSEYSIGEQMIFFNREGNSIRLRDIATIERRYVEPEKYIQYNGKRSIILAIEMCAGNNIVAFGEKVENIISEVQSTFPPDIKLHRITDQPKLVDKSVWDFIGDLVESMLVVIAVMLILFPLRTALVAGSGVPICTALTIFVMYFFKIELNTVTLAALIVVLGMIVDNSIIVIDGYSDSLAKGHSRWYSAAVSTYELFVPTLLATVSIFMMFFPMLGIITGPLGDFVKLFPWTIMIALVISLFYAVWVIPFLNFVFIRKAKSDKPSLLERIQLKFFDILQNGYDRLLKHCFRHPYLTLLTFVGTLVLAAFVFLQLNVQMLPKAERDCFAVEIHLTSGSTLEQTSTITDSLAHILRRDPRVKSVTSFVGCASPRFHATYAPEIGRRSYAQFIVNTIDDKATIELLKEYGPKYRDHFPNAYVRFKQMDYQSVKNPVEVQFKSNDLAQVEPFVDSLKAFMSQLPELTWVHSDYDESEPLVKIDLDNDEAFQFGITQAMVSLYLSSTMNKLPLTSIWEGNYKIPVMLYSAQADTSKMQELEDGLIPAGIPGIWLPLRQIAKIEPDWQKTRITRFNSIRTITVGSDLTFGQSQPAVMKKIQHYVETRIIPQLPEGVKVEYGGLTRSNKDMIPEIGMTIAAAIMVLFFFLLFHFKKFDVTMLSLGSCVLCLFGSCLGLWLFGLDFSITAVLGVISLIGIIVRNAIIMFEYSEQLRVRQHLTAKQAAFEAGKRRMRPIFLTSATTALGVIPMIISQSSLWMPMAVVICFGTLFTLPLTVTVLPVAYWQIYKKKGDKQ